MNRFELTILGCNSAIPNNGRFPSAQVLNVNEHLYLIDCGEGTQIRCEEQGIRKSKFNQIFISHLHGDHIYGLPGLLSSYSLAQRTEPLDIFAPHGIHELLESIFKYTQVHLSYTINYHIVDTSVSELIFEDEKMLIQSIPLSHRIPTTGYLFKEKPKPRKMKAEAITKYNIPYQLIPAIKKGADFEHENQIIPNRELTLPPEPIRSFAYCSDTTYFQRIIPIVKNVDLLYHESTFMESEKNLTEMTMHSTAKEAALIAKEANVGKLILGHFSSRYKDLNPLLEEATNIFKPTFLAETGRKFFV